MQIVISIGLCGSTLICLITVIISAIEWGDKIVTIKNPDIEKPARKRFCITLIISFVLLELSAIADIIYFRIPIDIRGTLVMLGFISLFTFMLSAFYPHSKKIKISPRKK